MAAPLVSIIIPSFNMRHCIGEAIGSVLAQTYSQIEIVDIDDGSTDETGDYIEAEYGDQVRYVYQPNRGRGAARKHGLRPARAEFIQFLDVDDILMPHKVVRPARFLDECAAYAAACGRIQTFFGGSPEHRWDRCDETDCRSGTLLAQEIQKPILTIMTMVRREWVERVGGFDEELRSNEDWDLWLRIAHAGGLLSSTSQRKWGRSI